MIFRSASKNTPPAKAGGSETLPRTRHRCVETAWGKMDLYDLHIEVRVKEGVEVDHAEFEEMRLAIVDWFGERPYGYMSVRENRYSVNPLAAKQRIVEVTNIQGGAFLVHSASAQQVLAAEKLFYNRPVCACSTMAEAEAFLAPLLR